MWMGANSMLALGSLEFAGAEKGLSHGKKRKPNTGRRKNNEKICSCL